jgi:MFS transporter, PAT family, solute carrier family 33 (acetyl-CoA transportor), member 1
MPPRSTARDASRPRARARESRSRSRSRSRRRARTTKAGDEPTTKRSTTTRATTADARAFAFGLPYDDFRAVCLLLLLYTLQGVPMGLSSSVGFILQERGASYGDQGVFSLASWPFSLKVLWAPVVDAVYVKSFGQRRTWVMPLQAIVGCTLLFLANALGELISADGSDVKTLTWTFFWLYLLLASQDIAVDGWALTMLSEKNVGLASTCNAIGQMVGFFVCFTGFLVLNSYGVDLGAFISFWGYVFIASSVFVYATKEVRCETQMSVKKAYAQAFSILRLPAVLKLSAVLLTRFVAFSASETLTTLKLLEKGVPKTHIATMSALMTPLNLAMPMLTRKWTAGARPLDTITKTWVWRGVACAFAALLVFYAPDVTSSGTIPYGYYAFLFAWLSVYSAFSNAHFISFMAFYNRVSDADMGGTYMTILNTVSNLGAKWMESVTLFTIDRVNTNVCVAKGTREIIGSCATDALKAACKGKCATTDTPYYIVVMLSPVIAYAWLRLTRKTIDWLSQAQKSHWRVKQA